MESAVCARTQSTNFILLLLHIYLNIYIILHLEVIFHILDLKQGYIISVINKYFKYQTEQILHMFF